MMRPVDPTAIDGKFAAIAEHVALLVIGGGPAGIAAAIAAAQAGMKVVLADENPLDPVLMGMDIPHSFGGRMTAAVQNRARMVEQITLNDPALAEAFDAGVDVRLGTSVWGLFGRDAEARTLPGLVAGLEDGSRCWLARCDHVIVAAGARDLMLGFTGWDQPGVMGAQALHALMTRYDACSACRLLILGSGALALTTALDAAQRGIAVAGLVEPRTAVQGPVELAASVAALGIPILTGHVIQAADGDAEGVSGATVIALDAELKPCAGSERRILCDTICQAIERVPNVELLAALGCDMTFDAARGGWAPALAGTQTSIAPVQAVGDCAGLGPLDAARAQGRQAAQVAAGAASPAAPSAPTHDTGKTWIDAAVWLTALTNACGHDVICCRCENVTAADVRGVRPPPYLNARDGRIAARDLGTLLHDGPPNQDQIKRLTRSGMGECQGRRCREQTALLLAAASGRAPGQIPLASYRAPVRPLPLGLLADDTETVAMRAGWDAWFGIPTQWTPWWDIGTDRDAVGRDAGLGEGSGATWHL